MSRIVPWGFLLVGVLGPGCASTRQAVVAESDRAASVEEVCRDASRRVEELERRDGELVERFLELRRQVTSLASAQHQVQVDLAELRQAVEVRKPASGPAADRSLEERLRDIEHRLEGLAAERKAMIEVLENALVQNSR